MPRWTPEARERQRQLIQHWKPWEHSTGSTSDYGKFVSSQNNPYCSDEWQQWQAIDPVLKQMDTVNQNRIGFDSSLAQCLEAIDVLTQIMRSGG